MNDPIYKGTRIPIGQVALHQKLRLPFTLPAVCSFIVPEARQTRQWGTEIEEYYPPPYKTDDSLQGNLRFALRHEPLDLRVISATLEAIGPDALADWVRSEPTGVFSRRVWFLYETLKGQTLDLESARSGNYVDMLDTKRHYVSTPVNSQRHRVRDNLLGSYYLCPIVRRTRRLENLVAAHLDRKVRELQMRYGPETLARAVNFLYTKETRSSFAIEGETPDWNREQRFVQTLHAASSFNPHDKGSFLTLQASIVDPRYAATDWRNFQNFVGETTRQFGQNVHFICPRPEDIPSLMQGWMTMADRLIQSPLDPVIAAAIISFSFVFIHPFEDGNGRIHRFLVHSVLSKREFSPPGIIFPVSAAILRNRHLYDQTLETFSNSIMPAIEWSFTANSAIVVENDTRDLYRFFDATTQAEYLYERVEQAIEIDFIEELDFLAVYDGAFTALRRIVDMPDRRASLLIRLLLQNGGRLSQNKRPQFEELTNNEVTRIEDAITEIMQSSPRSAHNTPS